jgi:hypothetical protein
MPQLIFGIFCLWVVYELISRNLTFFVLLALPLVSYWIYRTILKTKWLSNWESTQKQVALERQTEALSDEWRDFSMPPLQQFLDDTPLPYPTPFIVHRAHSILAAAYTMADFDRQILRPAQALAIYQQFVQATNEGLKEYAAHLPDRLKQTDTGLFQYEHAPTSEDLQRANRALARHFGSFSTILPDTQAEVEPRPTFHVWDEDKVASERREFERKLKDYDKYLEQIWDAQSPEQKTFSETSLYRFADSFAPQPEKVPFDIPRKERFAGTWIIAPSGQGKTNLMWHLIDADRKRRGTVVIMDSKGTLLNSYRGYDDAILIDAKTARINPFQIGEGDQAIDFIQYIFSLIAVTMTEKQQSLFFPVLRLVTKVPDGSLDTFKKILILGWRELNLGQYIQRCDPNTRDFFTLAKHGEPPSFDNPDYNETKRQIIWRFDLFLSKPAMQQIFSSSKSNVDFFQLLDSGKTILINNNTNDLGENGTEFFGRFFLALTWMAAIRRTDIPDDQKMPVHFYIDEAQTVIANDTKVPTILDECRSQMIALTIGHQRLNRITSKEVLDALFNCPVRFASVDNDAAAIAHRFNLPAEDLRLTAHKFACYVRYEEAARKMDKAVILDIPFFDKSQFPPYEAPPAPAPEPDPVIQPQAHPKKKQKPFKKDRQKAPPIVPSEDVEDF